MHPITTTLSKATAAFAIGHLGLRTCQFRIHDIRTLSSVFELEQNNVRAPFCEATFFFVSRHHPIPTRLIRDSKDSTIKGRVKFSEDEKNSLRKHSNVDVSWLLMFAEEGNSHGGSSFHTIRWEKNNDEGDWEQLYDWTLKSWVKTIIILISII